MTVSWLFGVYADQPFKAINPVCYLGVAVPRMAVAGVQRVLDDADIGCLRDYFHIPLGSRDDPRGCTLFFHGFFLL